MMISSTSSSSSKETCFKLTATANSAIQAIGLGYDITQDLRLEYCKGKSKLDRLIEINDDQVRDVVVPRTDGILIQNVSKSINCDKGGRVRFSTDVLSFQQMSEQFNQNLSLSGRIPTGQFSSAFELTGSWNIDAANTKSLAFDGVFITLYSIALEKSHISLRDHVKKAVPSWDPAALARFIEMYGTHVIVGVEMGGKDVLYLKQQHSSSLQPDEMQKELMEAANKRFNDATRPSNSGPNDMHRRELLEMSDYVQLSTDSSKEDITLFWRRRGGSNRRNIDHHSWCQSVQLEPDVISMSFIPISSLLKGVANSGYLTHAINIYLRYKPPIEELVQFLEFQLPRQWAPVFGELAVGPEKPPQNGASLRFSLLGLKLYINTNLVDVGNSLVTGLRLYLEGKRNNCLAIHLQHVESMPRSFQLQLKASLNYSNSPYDKRYYEKVQWKSFSHICTVPVESDDDLDIVTGAEFDVRDSGMNRVLFLRFHFAKVIGATVVKQPEWDGSVVLGSQNSGIISTLLSTLSGLKQPPKPSNVNLNSSLYPSGPPVSAQARKLLRFVDTSEMMRGPEDLPGYWVVSGGRLMVENGKISLRVKYSLLTVKSRRTSILSI